MGTKQNLRVQTGIVPSAAGVGSPGWMPAGRTVCRAMVEMRVWGWMVFVPLKPCDTDSASVFQSHLPGLYLPLSSAYSLGSVLGLVVVGSRGMGEEIYPYFLQNV